MSCVGSIVFIAMGNSLGRVETHTFCPQCGERERARGAKKWGKRYSLFARTMDLLSERKEER